MKNIQITLQFLIITSFTLLFALACSNNSSKNIYDSEYLKSKKINFDKKKLKNYNESQYLHNSKGWNFRGFFKNSLNRFYDFSKWLTNTVTEHNIPYEIKENSACGKEAKEKLICTTRKKKWFSTSEYQRVKNILGTTLCALEEQFFTTREDYLNDIQEDNSELHWILKKEYRDKLGTEKFTKIKNILLEKENNNTAPKLDEKEVIEDQLNIEESINKKINPEQKEDIDQKDDATTDKICSGIILDSVLDKIQIKHKDYEFSKTDKTKSHYVFLLPGLGRDYQNDFSKIRANLEKLKNCKVIDFSTYKNKNRPHSVSGSVLERAKYIETEIAYFIQNNPKCKISLIGHSQGGVTFACMSEILKLPTITNFISLNSPFMGAKLVIGADYLKSFGKFNTSLNGMGVMVEDNCESYKGLYDLHPKTFELKEIIKKNLEELSKRGAKLYFCSAEEDKLVDPKSALASDYDFSTNYYPKTFSLKGNNAHMDILAKDEVIKYIMDKISKN